MGLSPFWVKLLKIYLGSRLGPPLHPLEAYDVTGLGRQPMFSAVWPVALLPANCSGAPVLTCAEWQLSSVPRQPPDSKAARQRSAQTGQPPLYIRNQAGMA